MKLICFLLGHKYFKYLQTSEGNSIDEWDYKGVKISKKVVTFFYCKRCCERYTLTECFKKGDE